MKVKFVKKAVAIAVAVSLGAASLAGCSSATDETQAQSGTETVQTSDSGETQAQAETEAVTENDPIDPDAVALEIADMQVMAPELFYFYLSMRTQMEYTYQALGTVDWTMVMYDGGPTYGEYLKTMVESQLLQILFWNTYAQEDNITLSDDDQEQIAAFTDEEKEQCVYRTVQHILLKTEMEAETDESGNAETVSEEDAQSFKDEQKAKAEEVLAKAQAGEDFEALADEYNEDSGFEYSLNSSGQSPAGVSYVQEFTDGAFALSEGEVAIVETEYGYHVMKCISENDEELGQEAQRTLAVNKYNEIYQQWLTDNEPAFYDGWQNYAVLNTPALPSQAEAESEAAAESEATAETEAESQADGDTQAPESEQS